MSAGCCCLVSDIAGHRDLIVHRETGLLHPPGDAEQLAACIAESLGDPVLRRRLGASARRAVADRTWQTAARDVVDFIERFL
jgi:glycosyltransferase involved in cell wall biosynthesis